jgi:FtsH-binding integral membrane protein
MLKRVVSVLALGLLAALVAAIGAGAHRSTGYLGVVLVLALIAFAGVFAKAWQSWNGYVGFAAVWVGVTVFFASTGPAQSQLVAGDLKDQLWVYGGVAVLCIVAMVPRFVLVGRDVAP